MQILPFSEPLIKPALQDKSKCFTIRKAWYEVPNLDELLKEGIVAKDDELMQKWRIGDTNFFEQQECRYKVGELRQLYWKQRSRKKECGNNCAFRKDNVCTKFDCMPFYPDNISFQCFSKIFGVGKILQTPKIWMDTQQEGDKSLTLIVRDNTEEPLEIITKNGIFFTRTPLSISRADGFKNPPEFRDFFLNTYPILSKERMPFWRIGWDWQP